ncbi:MAG: aspartate aminotransferase family protein [Gemmatimonadetes bacterium]|nr:aspartate aminotransferase family protein [Gemmatimonadota bacterium]
MSRESAHAARAGDVVAAHREYMLPSLTTYYDEPLVLDAGSGSRVWDVDGREYLDGFGGILTTSLGHCHPRVVDAVREQVGKLGHTSTLYLTEPMLEAARRLAELAPGALKRTFFSSSGSEAVETAIGLARAYTGRTEVIALRGAYHGRSAGAISLTANASWRVLPSTQSGIAHALAPYPYRCPFRQPCDERCAEAFARDLEEAILTSTNGQPAAFIAEAIQGVNGVIVPPPGYFQRAAEIIRRYGGLFIVDEVQTGFGRTGGRWFGIEHSGVVPDIMVMAKGIAAGLPVSATMTTDEIAAGWTGKIITTFGGNPILMAGMVAALDVMVEEDVPTLAAARGARLRDGLESLALRHEWIGEVRGMGLMQGMELVEDRAGKAPSPRRAKALLEAARTEGLLIGLGGLHGQVVRVGPHLLFSDAEIDELVERLGRACARVG